MVLARLLVPSDFGLVAMVTVISSILVEFGTLRLGDATVQKEEINHQLVSTLFWINVALCTALALLFIAVSPFIAWFYKEPRLKAITMIIAGGFIFSGLSIQHAALLRRRLEFYKLTSITIAATIICDGMAIVLAWQNCGYWALVARHIGLPITFAIGLWTLCRWIPGLPSKTAGVAPMLKFGINSLGNYTTDYLSRSLDKVLVGWRYGTQSLGFYERAYHLFVLPVNQLSYPLTSVAVATLSRLQNEPEKFRHYYLNALAIIAFIGMPLSAVLTLIGKDLILLLLGPQWDEAGNIFTFFAPGVGMMLVYGTNGWIHLSTGRADRWFRWGIIAFLTIAVFYVIGLPFGGSGIAIAYAAFFFITTLPCLIYAGTPVNLRLASVVSIIWKYCISALGAGLICWLIYHSFDSIFYLFNELNILARIPVSAVLCIVIYLGLLIAISGGTKEIRRFLNTLSEMLPGFSRKTQTTNATREKTLEKSL